MSSSDTQNPAPEKKTRQIPWHYTPNLPIVSSPYFRRPFDVLAILKWMIGGWFPLSERLIILGLSIGSWTYLHPTLERSKQFSFDWVAQIYLINFSLMLLVAGGLHCYFYVWKCQKDERHYDRRPFAKENSNFTFNSQVKDNMFWSLASGVTVWTAYEAIMLWALANGYVTGLSLPEDLIWLALFIFLLPAWETVHFFMIHRLIHWSPLYERVHKLHHRNTNVGPWSGLSMHPVEHLVYLSTVLIHFIIPANPLLIIFHLQYFTLSAATTHTGFQGITMGGKLILPLGTFHHQLHHRYFSCNYGGLEIPWDQWTGSFHDGTDESHQRFLERRRVNAKKKAHA